MAGSSVVQAPSREDRVQVHRLALPRAVHRETRSLRPACMKGGAELEVLAIQRHASCEAGRGFRRRPGPRRRECGGKGRDDL